MRIAFNSFPNNLADQLGGLTSKQSKLQLQVSSGQRIQLAEDDPTAMQQVLNMQIQAHQISQYKANIARAQETATASYGAIKSLNKISNRADEISTLADGLASPQQLTIYANELNELIQQAVSVANTKNRESYILGGTKNDQPPYVLEADASGKVTGVTYQGNDSVNEIEISPGSTIVTQVTGSSTGGRGLITDTAAGADFFNHLISLRDNLLAGDTSTIASTIHPQLRNDADNFLYHIGLNGATQSRLETANSTLTDQSLSLNSQVSNQASTNLPEAIIRLNQAQTAYQAALQSSSKMLNLSLMDYLR